MFIIKNYAIVSAIGIIVLAVAVVPLARVPMPYLP